jgi:hypothetical protein
VHYILQLVDKQKRGEDWVGTNQPNGCRAEEGVVPLNLADAEGDEGGAEASREQADLWHLEVLHGAKRVNHHRGKEKMGDP